ncbi:uncharacterized protein LOC135167892 isoform X2 [Diachasmimorpha longicaudata]
MSVPGPPKQKSSLKLKSSPLVTDIPLSLNISGSDGVKLPPWIITTKTNLQFKCLLCNQELMGFKNTFQHAKSWRHMKKLDVRREKQCFTNENNNLCGPLVNKIGKVCCESKGCLSGPKLKRLPSSRRDVRAGELPQGIIGTNRPCLFKCVICNLIVKTYIRTFEHVKGKRHLQQLDLQAGKKLASENNSQLKKNMNKLSNNTPPKRKPSQKKIRVPTMPLSWRLENRDPDPPVPPARSQGPRKVPPGKSKEAIQSWRTSGRISYADKVKEALTESGKRKKRKSKRRISKGLLTCHLCAATFESRFSKELHCHMTSHVWNRFVKSAEDAAPHDVNKLPDESLKEKSGESEDEEDLEFDPGQSTQVTTDRFPNFANQYLDISQSHKLNIYAVDKQKIKYLKLGVLLSFSIDRDRIYCLVCRKSIENSHENFYTHLCSAHHLQYLQQMMKDHETFKGYPDQLSDLALAHEYMEELSDNVVRCHGCGTSTENDSLKLKEHIEDPNHVTKCLPLGANAKNWFTALCSVPKANFYSTWKYWCVPCNARRTTEAQFRRHLRREAHKQRMENLKDTIMIFDYCVSCASLWYGFLETFSYHSECKMHKHLAVNSPFVVSELPYAAKRLLQAPEKTIEQILARIEACRIDSKKQEDLLIRDLVRISVEAYPKVKVYPFGSRVSGLAGRNSDLDVFLDCGGKIQQALFQITKIQRCLEKDVQNWNICRVIRDTRVPIIKAIHKPTGIDCDISFDNDLSVEKTKVIKTFCEKCPDCRRLIIFLKNWMGHCELSGQQGISSYGIAWMVVYFLQVKMIIPTIHELKERKKESRSCGSLKTLISTDFQAADHGQGFRELLGEFFKFYELFDYRDYVICPLVGRPVAKADFQWSAVLPQDMTTYIDYFYKEKGNQQFSLNSTMCLQDPLDLAHNITKSMHKWMVNRFKSFCSFSAQILDCNA